MQLITVSFPVMTFRLALGATSRGCGEVSLITRMRKGARRGEKPVMVVSGGAAWGRSEPRKGL